jgi:hypothetical protein
MNYPTEQDALAQGMWIDNTSDEIDLSELRIAEEHAE